MTSENDFWEKMRFIPDTQMSCILADRISAEAYKAPSPPPLPPLAQSCLRAAADMGDTQAMMRLGVIAMDAGDGQAGYDWYCKAGNGEGLFCIGRACLFGEDGEKKDPARALEWYRRAGDAGYAEGYWGMAEIYHRGRAGDVDMEKACYWYTRAAEGGDVKSMYETGSYYRSMAMDTTDATDRQAACQKSLYWLMRAAEHDYPRAFFILATAYCGEEEDDIVPQDYHKSMIMLQHKLKHTIDCQTIATLGYYYEMGLGSSRNATLAALLYVCGLEDEWNGSDAPEWVRWRDRHFFEAHLDEISVLRNEDVDFFLSAVARLSKESPIARSYLETRFFYP